jgi:hypothetical protein
VSISRRTSFFIYAIFCVGLVWGCLLKAYDSPALLQTYVVAALAVSGALSSRFRIPSWGLGLVAAWAMGMVLAAGLCLSFTSWSLATGDTPRHGFGGIVSGMLKQGALAGMLVAVAYAITRAATYHAKRTALPSRLRFGSLRMRRRLAALVRAFVGPPGSPGRWGRAAVLGIMCAVLAVMLTHSWTPLLQLHLRRSLRIRIVGLGSGVNLPRLQVTSARQTWRIGARGGIISSVLLRGVASTDSDLLCAFLVDPMSQSDELAFDLRLIEQLPPDSSSSSSGADKEERTIPTTTVRTRWGHGPLGSSSVFSQVVCVPDSAVLVESFHEMQAHGGGSRGALWELVIEDASPPICPLWAVLQRCTYNLEIDAAVDAAVLEFPTWKRQTEDWEARTRLPVDVPSAAGAKWILQQPEWDGREYYLTAGADSLTVDFAQEVIASAKLSWQDPEAGARMAYGRATRQQVASGEAWIMSLQRTPLERPLAGLLFISAILGTHGFVCGVSRRRGRAGRGSTDGPGG